mgnify:CR=1 FL=1
MTALLIFLSLSFCLGTVSNSGYGHTSCLCRTNLGEKHCALSSNAGLGDAGLYTTTTCSLYELCSKR